METNKNMLYYEQLRAVPEDAQKEFNTGRFSGTDINPMWRIKRMTEVFGMCGFGWYVEIVNRHLKDSTDGQTICAFVSLNLYIKVNGEWSKPIYGEGGNTMCNVTKKGEHVTSDEAFKMAYTDAFSNATKQLGLGADIWFKNDKVHSTKYDRQQEELFQAPKPQPTPQPQQPTPTPKPQPTPQSKPQPHPIIKEITGLDVVTAAGIAADYLEKCMTIADLSNLYNAIKDDAGLFDLLKTRFADKKQSILSTQKQ